MAKRYVRASGKNSQGDITKLCNSGEHCPPAARRTRSATSKAEPTNTG